MEQFSFGSWIPSGSMSELDTCCAADGPVPCVILSTVAGGLGARITRSGEELKLAS